MTGTVEANKSFIPEAIYAPVSYTHLDVYKRQNLAIVSIGGGKAEIKILARSSRESMKDYLNTALESCFSMAGMEVTLSLIHIYEITQDEEGAKNQ